MNNEGKHHGGNAFFNGFLLGVIVGACFIFLLATKKGKRILKIIVDEGLESFSEFGDILENEDGEIDMRNRKEAIHEEESSPTLSAQLPSVVKAKRFFKGIHKRSNA